MLGRNRDDYFESSLNLYAFGKLLIIIENYFFKYFFNVINGTVKN